MRLAVLVLSSLLFLPATSTSHPAPSRVADPAPARASADPRPAYAPGELLVGWRDDGAFAAKARESVAAAYGLEPLAAPELESLGGSRFRVPDGRDPAEVAAEVAALPGVRYAEPNAILYPADVPTDDRYSGVHGQPTDLQRWAFQGVGTSTVLDAEAAWDVTKGDPSTVIAVVDSGLDLDNPEFKSLWVNRREIPGNGVDDDGNGYVDDVNGYDFHNMRGDVNPDLGDGIDNDGNDQIDEATQHGTITASIVSAAHDGQGIVGGAPDCSLMVIKVFGDEGGASAAQITAAIKYAADNGVDVMNLSLTTYLNSEALLDAVRYALDKNVVVVAAAGNGASGVPLYPASYQLVVSVGGSGSGFSEAAIETDGLDHVGSINGRWPKSQYGRVAVKVVAPAVVYSSSVASVGYADQHPGVAAGDTFYGIFEGTSFAAPYVTALAGLVVTRDKAVYGRRTLSPQDVLTLLKRTANELQTDSIGGAAWDGYGRVDYAKALNGIPGTGDPNPTIAVVNYNKKTLTIRGDGFSLLSQVEVNGTVVGTPAFSYTDETLVVSGKKKTLGLKKRGTNTIVVVERGVRSAEFVY